MTQAETIMVLLKIKNPTQKKILKNLVRIKKKNLDFEEKVVVK
jgi:hypothetical protein